MPLKFTPVISVCKFFFDFIIVLGGLGGCLLVFVGCLSCNSDSLVGCLVMASLLFMLLNAFSDEHLTTNNQPNDSFFAFIRILFGLYGWFLVLVGCLSDSDILVGCLLITPLALKLLGASPIEHLTKNIQPNNSTDGHGGTAGGANQQRWDGFEPVILFGWCDWFLVLVGCLSSSMSDILVSCLLITKNIQPNNSTDGQSGTAGGANQRRWDGFEGTAPKKTAAKKKDPPSGTGASAGPKANRANQNRKQKQQQQQQLQQSNLDNVHCHYTVLGITQTASSAEIKKAYRNMALKYHPDKNSDEDAADIFRRVQSAYEILGNDQTRISYDAQRCRGGCT